MATPREVSLSIFLDYLKEWTKDTGVPWTGHGQYILEVGVYDDTIRTLYFTKGKASIKLK